MAAQKHDVGSARYEFEYAFRDLTRFTTGYFLPFSPTKLYFGGPRLQLVEHLFLVVQAASTLEALRSMGTRRTRSLPLGESPSVHAWRNLVARPADYDSQLT